MEKETYRRFEIPRGNNRLPYTFAVRTDKIGGTQVTRVSPYDETEYHWASKSPDSNRWSIIRKGRTVRTVGFYIDGEIDAAAEAFSPEQIAYFLIKADMNAHLEPRISHN